MSGSNIDWGHDREKPEGVKINLTHIGPGMHPEEKFVQFQIGGASYSGWMPSYSVNEFNNWLKAFIIADFDDGRWLLRIPDETLTSGPQIFAKKEDQGTVVTTGWW